MNVHCEKLCNAYDQICGRLSENDCNDLVSLLREYFDGCKATVLSFFVEKKEEISNIYKAIRENAYPYNRISACDVNTMMHEYSEYCEGMAEFISRLMELQNSDGVDVNAIANKLTSVTDKDVAFINGLGSEVEVIDIDSAMKNVEVLIDVYSNFNNYLSIVERLNNMMDDEYSIQKKEGLKLIVESICRYHKEVIKKILVCYDDITSSIQTRTPVSGTKTVDRYQMF